MSRFRTLVESLLKEFFLEDISLGGAKGQLATLCNSINKYLSGNYGKKFGFYNDDEKNEDGKVARGTMPGNRSVTQSYYAKTGYKFNYTPSKGNFAGYTFKNIPVECKYRVSNHKKPDQEQINKFHVLVPNCEDDSKFNKKPYIKFIPSAPGIEFYDMRDEYLNEYLEQAKAALDYTQKR